ncbi:MAG: hypothetical protein QGG84_00045, partial [Rhodospirillales bacterium]|nr:hypothetical protein [Rhodospirillales bacterium]
MEKLPCLCIHQTIQGTRTPSEEREDPWASAQQGPHPIPSQVSDMCFEDFDINGDGVLNVLDIVGWINA